MSDKIIKIKDLPGDTNLQNIKIKLPEEVYAESSLPLYKIENVPVYLQGWVMGDFFVKINLEDDQIYPMFWDNVPPNFEEWQIIDSEG